MTTSQIIVCILLSLSAIAIAYLWVRRRQRIIHHNELMLNGIPGISDSTRMEFLCLLGKRAGNLLNALKRDGVSSEACQTILRVFRKLQPQLQAPRMCYKVAYPRKIDNSRHFLIRRLELLAEAHRKGKIGIQAYNTMVSQIHEMLMANHYIPKTSRQNPEKTTSEAASVL